MGSWMKLEFNKTLKVMMAAHPGTFFGKDSEETRPLKLGIKQELIAAHPEFKPSVLRRFIGIYCGKNRYMRAVVARRPRRDLDGNDVGEPTDSHVEHCAKILRDREEAQRVAGVAA